MPSPAQAVSTAPSATPETTSAQSTESSQASESTASSAANGASNGEEVQSQPAWREALLSADRDEVLKELLESTDSDRLLRQPKLSGLLGDLAERRARAKEIEIEKRLTERQEQQRLRTLRDEDPYAYAQEHKRRDDDALAAESVSKENSRTLNAWAADINSEIAGLARTLPQDIVEKLSTKKYEGTLGQGLRAYVSDIIEASRESWLAAEQDKWKKNLMPALRKEALAKVNGGAESADVTSGGAASAGELDHAEWQRNGKDRIWRQANKERINSALANGRIRPLS